MKKILLCLFFLTSLNFYSQVADMVHCGGDTTFNLTTQYSLLIGNLNPAETTVSYHLTAADASTGVNAISNPTTYITAEASKIIYARIDHLGTITTNYFSLIVSPTLNVTASNKPILCKGETASLTINVTNGQEQYQYSINGGAFTNNNYYSYLPAGIYNIQILNVITSCLSTINYIITEPTAITATSMVANQTAIINAQGGTGALKYSLNGLNYQANNVFENLSLGNYNILTSDSNGCSSAVSVSITTLNPITYGADITKPIDCTSNASIKVTATGGQTPYTYSINGGAYQISDVFNNLPAGLYNIAVKDAVNTVANTNTTTITPLLPLTMTATQTDVSCNGGSNGLITVIVTGGQAPYVYSLDNGVTYVSSNIFTNFAAGTYNIVIKDALNCLSSNFITIRQPNALSMTTAITQPIDCISNATVTVTATGGTAPYTYSKDGITFVQSNVFDNLVAGSSTTYVKDANGCINQNSIVISPLVPLSATFTKSDIHCKGDDNGYITINTSGGNGQYTYSINGGNPQSSNEFKNLASGTYTIVVTSGYCVNSLTIFITEPLPLNTTISLVNQTVTVNATGGSGTYKYALDGGILFQESNTFNEIIPGSHFIMTEDQNGCIVISPIFIINTPAPLINGSTIVNQTFTQGQTLGDIIIAGENIKWYSNATPSTGKLKKANETPLPLSTVLVDGTTYYASQTINGIESTERLAVTAKLGSLGTTDFVIEDFTYYPNPVKNIFTISNTSIIDEVSLISIKGETVLTKKINSLHSEIDLSNFSKGVYFLKVKAEGTAKTVKLIKE